MAKGYITGLAYTEVTAYDEMGKLLETIRTRLKDNKGEWITNKQARKHLKETWGEEAFKIKRRHVWNFDTEVQ